MVGSPYFTNLNQDENFEGTEVGIITGDNYLDIILR